jgi:hypothetical protein
VEARRIGQPLPCVRAYRRMPAPVPGRPALPAEMPFPSHRWLLVRPGWQAGPLPTRTPRRLGRPPARRERPFCSRPVGVLSPGSGVRWRCGGPGCRIQAGGYPDARRAADSPTAVARWWSGVRCYCILAAIPVSAWGDQYEAARVHHATGRRAIHRCHAFRVFFCKCSGARRILRGRPRKMASGLLLEAQEK